MIFNSFIFFIFLGVALPVYYALRSTQSRNIFLLLASYFFYGYWDWRFCSLLAFTTIVDYFIGDQIFKTDDAGKRKRLLIVSLVVNLGILGFFKYFNFFVENFQELSTAIGIPLDFVHLNIILPVGLSFYVFHNLSYIVDIYRKKIEPCRDIVVFGLFVTFFPQLVAGPIGRASFLLPQLSKRMVATTHQVKQGIVLITMGLFRKVMIGDTTGRYVDHIFEHLEVYNSVEIICAIVLFAVQIYADFSGYSLIARGTSKLFGVELMKNFEQPYLSRNITEFWRRWHISLSSWLRDYLYISLGGNRKGAVRTYVNLMLTMLLGGLWHGASWNFVVWGGLHGLYLVIHKLFTGDRRIAAENKWPFGIKDWMNVIFTNVLVLFAWIFFRSTSWETTRILFSRIWHWESSEYSLWFIGTTLTYLLLTLALDLFAYASGKHTYLLRIKSAPLRHGIMAATLIFTLFYLFQSNPMPFIYFKF
ncbi:MAG: MBOAT family protein [Flavobacteriales bacterium]|nr:MBOAT family protein [Flavobacteriales bacterium]